MPKFAFTITAPATISAQVEVEAETIEEAQALALAPSFFQDPTKAQFTLDEGNIVQDAYLPDESDYQEVPASPAL